MNTHTYTYMHRHTLTHLLPDPTCRGLEVRWHRVNDTDSRSRKETPAASSLNTAASSFNTLYPCPALVPRKHLFQTAVPDYLALSVSNPWSLRKSSIRSLSKAFGATSRNLAFVTGLWQGRGSDKNIRYSDHGALFTTFLDYNLVWSPCLLLRLITLSLI